MKHLSVSPPWRAAWLYVLSVFLMLPALAQAQSEFQAEKYLVYTIIDEDNHQMRVDGFSKDIINETIGLIDLEIPSVQNTSSGTYNVVEVAEKAFAGNQFIRSVTMPDGMKVIGEAAFRSCNSLSEVDLGNTVENIGDEAFKSTAISTISFPASLKTVGLHAFSHIENLTIGHFPAIEDFSRYNYEDCPKILNYTVDANSQQYSEKDGLLLSKDGTELIRVPNGREGVITVPDGVTTIGAFVFASDGHKAHTVIFPASVNDFGMTNFRYNKSLTTLVFLNPVPPTTNGTFNEMSEAGVAFTCYVPKGSQSAYQNSEWGLYTGDTFELPAVGETFDDGEYIYKVLSYTDWTVALAGQVYPGPNSPRIAPSYEVNYMGLPFYLTEVADKAFMNSTETEVDEGAYITSVILPEGLKKVGDNAFDGCKRLATVQFPSTIEEIGAGAFEECALTDINIKNLPALKRVGPNAFGYNSTLTEGYFPAQEGWSQYAYSACSEITQFTIADNHPEYTVVDGLLLSKDGTTLKMVPAGAKYVNVPETVTAVGKDAFGFCSKITNIDMPSSLKNMDAGRIFVLNYALTTMEMPTLSAPAVSEATFEDMSAQYGEAKPTLKVLKGMSEAYNNTEWSKYFIIEEMDAVPYSLRGAEFDDGILRYRAYWTQWQSMDAEVLGLVDISYDKPVFIPSTISCAGYDLNVTRIGDVAFMGGNTNRNLPSISVSSSIQEIGESAFAETASTNTRLFLPLASDWTALQVIGGSAFSNSSLTSFEVPANVQVLEDWALACNPNLTEITFNEGLYTIKNGAIARNPKLERIILPGSLSTLKTMEYTLFMGNESLKEVIVKEGDEVDVEFDMSDEDFEQSVLAEAVERYADVKFYAPKGALGKYIDLKGWRNFENFNVSHVGETAYVGDAEYTVTNMFPMECELTSAVATKEVKSITVPETVTINGYEYRVVGIGKNAFYGNKGLQTVTLNHDIDYIGEAAFYESGITSLPDLKHVKRIGARAFSYTSGITSLEVPANVTSVGAEAFVGMSDLTEAKFDATTDVLGDGIFWACNNLEKLDVLSNAEWVKNLWSHWNGSDRSPLAVSMGTTTPPELYGDNLFVGVVNPEIYVPYSAVDAYQNHAVWGRYTIIGADIAGARVTIDENATEANWEASNNATVTIQRTFSGTAWGTICLPFDVSNEQLQEVFGNGTRLGQFSRNVDTKFYFTTGNTDGIKAGVPYIIIAGNTSVVNPVFTNCNLVAPGTEKTVAGDGYVFTGNYTKVTISSNDYGFSTTGSIGHGRVGTTPTMKGVRAYLKKDNSSVASAHEAVFIVDDVVTAIEDVEVEEGQTEGKVYSLQGQYLGETTDGLPAGVYIINGQKVTIK